MFPVEVIERTIGNFVTIADEIGLPFVQAQRFVPMGNLVRFLVACAFWIVTSFPFRQRLS
jgi:hypothetical protein